MRGHVLIVWVVFALKYLQRIGLIPIGAGLIVKLFSYFTPCLAGEIRIRPFSDLN